MRKINFSDLIKSLNDFFETNKKNIFDYNGWVLRTVADKITTMAKAVKTQAQKRS